MSCSLSGKSHPMYRHGHSLKGNWSRAYRKWAGMMNRCGNQKDRNWPNYGGRDITVCDRWRDFLNFLEDMGEPPEGTTLDRIDNEKGYTPRNCRWATPKQQARNRRTNTMLSFRGRTMCVAEWAEELGWSQVCIISRLERGWTIERTLTQIPRARKLPDEERRKRKLASTKRRRDKNKEHRRDYQRKWRSTCPD